MCLNETCSKVRIGEHLSDSLSIQNGLRQGDALSPLFFNFVLEYSVMNVQANQDGLEVKQHISFWIMLMIITYLVKTLIL
jgi:hypothetical protein